MRAGRREIRARAVRIDTLQGNLLHLADGPTVIGDDAALVNLADEKRTGGNSSLLVPENDLAAVDHRLRPA